MAGRSKPKGRAADASTRQRGARPARHAPRRVVDHDHLHDHDHGHPPRATGGGGPALHRGKAHAGVGKVGAAVITVSSTRNEVNDESGGFITRAFERAGHEVHFYKVVKDDLLDIQRAVREALSTPGVDIVVTNGGTGMSRSDLTIEAVGPLLDRRADGWGDVFRAVSTKQIGTAAFLSRSIAGTVGPRWVVSIPGSPGAARTAMERVLLPELEHMLWEARR